MAVWHPGKDLYEVLHPSQGDDLQRSYLFKVIFNGGDIITHLTSSTGTPVETSDTKTVKWLSSYIKVAGDTSYAPWTVTVKDNNKGEVHDYFTRWREVIYHKIKGTHGTCGLPKQYKQAIFLDMLASNGETISSYIMRGAYPSSIGSTSLDYSASTFANFPVTFEFDDFIWEKKSRSPGGTSAIANQLQPDFWQKS